MSFAIGSGNYNGIADILKHKHPNTLEIETTLFENCDVVCTFCGHEKNDTFGMSRDEMMAKLKTIERYLQGANKDVLYANVHLLGGELFQDGLMTGKEDCFLNYYWEWLEKYKEICLKHGFIPRAIFVTNNLTKKPEIVKDFLERIRKELMICELIVSYDMAGRPITRQYRFNMGFFREYIANLNMVATSATIEAIMSKKDPYFQTLYCEYPIYIDDFLPDPESENLIPSDELLLEFMNFCADNYPKILPYGKSVEVMRSNSDEMIEVSGSTLNKMTILPNGKMTNYAWERHLPEYFNRPFSLEDNTNMLFDFVMENNCLSCQHFSYCHMRCPVQWSWTNRKRSEGCVNKRFYDKLRL